MVFLSLSIHDFFFKFGLFFILFSHLDPTAVKTGERDLCFISHIHQVLVCCGVYSIVFGWFLIWLYRRFRNVIY